METEGLTDGWTKVKKLMVAFVNFVNACKKQTNL